MCPRGEATEGGAAAADEQLLKVSFSTLWVRLTCKPERLHYITLNFDPRILHLNSATDLNLNELLT